MAISKIRRAVFCASIVGIVCSCSASSVLDYTPQQGKVFFKSHENEFGVLKNLISSCKGWGTISIYQNGRVIASEGDTIKCPQKNEIAKGLKKLGVLWVDVSGEEPYGKLGPMGGVFVLSSSGTVVRGGGSAIYYFPNEVSNPFGDSTPLAGSPGHWFFRELGDG
ncbi:MAG: hypothetical protein ABFC67_14390 [Mizugakiibacter sp.]|uniref:hypothetical protein n=1 Tax=Mizugakiibacter sp. TaxID=1972610 RepID=UPI0031C71CB8|nr:hypothetical protein [Xanthomonadaceae bacterium]